MPLRIAHLSILLLLPSLALPAAGQEVDDPYLWLEEVEGEDALEWVRARNAETLADLQRLPAFDAIYEQSLAILNSDDRIASPSFMGDHVYNFWRDAEHERGLWRRTTLRSYLDDVTVWETVLDIDALVAEEGVNWVWKGATCRAPAYDRCMVSLSRGGADAVETREFDLASRSFVEDGFYLPESKGGVVWKDRNTLYVATDFGEGTMTTSGYPRVVKAWRRGTPLATAKTIFEAEPTDVGLFATSLETADETQLLLVRPKTFFEYDYYLIEDDRPVRVDLPDDAQPARFEDHLLVLLKSAWNVGGETHPQGALISIDYDAFLAGARDFQVVVAPDERSTVEGIASTRSALLVNLLRDVKSELYSYRYEDGTWRAEQMSTPEMGTIGLEATSPRRDDYFFTYSSYVRPTTLYYAGEGGQDVRPVRQLPSFFDEGRFVVRQFQATSADGTRVPYFLVHAGGIDFDGGHPTLLYGYGGFEVSIKPGYNATVGAAWLERGGVYAVANIRGGGEFGPAWHQAALKANRQRAYDDFIAVAEDLIERGVTSPEHLGIYGGSNGGLLTGAVTMQRPELFGAVISAVPLLDMRRFHTMLAGASWMGEYGNPEVPEEWAFLERYSPYHNVREDADYPRILFTTSTRDDRVHPGHARKMAARMMELGHDVYLYENMEGGHAGAADNRQRAFMHAVMYTYLLRQLGDD